MIFQSHIDLRPLMSFRYIKLIFLYYLTQTQNCDFNPTVKPAFLGCRMNTKYPNDPEFSDRANCADPDQTAPRGAV